jgi:hypothetical protein
VAGSSLVQLSIRGGDVAIINKSVFAALMSPPNATTWVATAAGGGTIQFADQASGLVLGVPNTDVGTQAVATPSGSGAAASSWIVTEFSDDSGDDATPITDPAELTSGFYTLQEPGTQEFLYRNRIEDYSLMPKRVALQNVDSPGSYELIIRVVG